MLIKDIMSTSVITANKIDSVVEVAQVLSKNKIHAVPVVDDSIPIGIITESDFFTKGAINIYLPAYIDIIKTGILLNKVPALEKGNVDKLIDAKAEDIMSSPCTTINQDANVEEFMNLIREKNFSSVPVVDDSGSLVGIVTMFDVIHLLKPVQ